MAGESGTCVDASLHRLGIGVIPATMYFLAACQHMWEGVRVGNYAPNNLWPGIADFIIPLTFLVLFLRRFRLTGKAANEGGKS